MQLLSNLKIFKKTSHSRPILKFRKSQDYLIKLLLQNRIDEAKKLPPAKIIIKMDNMLSNAVLNATRPFCTKFYVSRKNNIAKKKQKTLVQNNNRNVKISSMSPAPNNGVITLKNITKTQIENKILHLKPYLTEIIHGNVKTKYSHFYETANPATMILDFFNIIDPRILDLDDDLIHQMIVMLFSHTQPLSETVTIEYCRTVLLPSLVNEILNPSFQKEVQIIFENIHIPNGSSDDPIIL